MNIRGVHLVCVSMHILDLRKLSVKELWFWLKESNFLCLNCEDWWNVHPYCREWVWDLSESLRIVVSYGHSFSKFISAGVRHHHHVLQKDFWQCRQVGLRSKRTSAWKIMGKSWAVQKPKKAKEKVQKKKHMLLWAVASSSLYSMTQERSMIKYLETFLSHLNFLASRLPIVCLLYLFSLILIEFFFISGGHRLSYDLKLIILLKDFLFP